MANLRTTAIIAMGIGYAGGMGTGALTADAGINDPRSEIVNATMDPGESLDLRVMLQDRICSEVDKRLGLSGDSSCDASKHLVRACFRWDDGAPRISAAVSIPGRWVSGE